MLVNALERALSERVTLLNDVTLGRRGFLTYLKALGGSNVVKITPSNGNASGLRVTDKTLKVVCGANTSYLADSQWIGDNTPVTLCDVRISPNNSVKPNLGALELAEALSRVLPFTAREDTRPILQCVLFRAIEGKLYLVSADGFRLSVISLDYDDGEGEALVNREELKGISSALRRAKRVRLAFEGEDLKSLILDTELVRYKWISDDGKFPEYEKLIPSEHNCITSFDTTEAISAVNSLKALSDTNSHPIDLTIGNGKIVMANPDDKGNAEISAETQGEVRIRLDGSYLAEALKACGGMAELKLTDGKSPALFTTNGYKLVVMPMLTSEVKPEPAQAEPEAETEPEVEVETDAVAEAEAVIKESKPKRKGKVKEPVAVA
ncbi:MAG: DNA polymerase III subunit beta [Dehalococcoidales bacterium]|nr:DNA polymerase III subunit beta [Dehalococcoidales bacterium]